MPTATGLPPQQERRDCQHPRRVQAADPARGESEDSHRRDADRRPDCAYRGKIHDRLPTGRDGWPDDRRPGADRRHETRSESRLIHASCSQCGCFPTTPMPQGAFRPIA